MKTKNYKKILKEKRKKKQLNQTQKGKKQTHCAFCIQKRVSRGPSYVFFFGVNGWKALIKKKLSACCRSWQPAQDRAKTTASVPVGVAVGVAVSWLMTNLRRQWKWLIFVFSFICVFLFCFFFFFWLHCKFRFFRCCCRCCRGVWQSVNTISNIVSIHKVGLLFSTECTSA